MIFDFHCQSPHIKWVWANPPGTKGGIRGRGKDVRVPRAEVLLLESRGLVFLGLYREAGARRYVTTGKSSLKDNPELPDLDLIIVWHEIPPDIVDSPDLERIDLITYNCPGDHREHRFLLAKSPGIAPDSTLSKGRAVDVGATILNF